jgi:hypothetical protein
MQPNCKSERSLHRKTDREHHQIKSVINVEFLYRRYRVLLNKNVLLHNVLTEQ